MQSRPISPFNAFLMLALITFWGSSFVIVKIILNEGLTPTAIATYRFLIAGILFIPALLIQKKRNHNYNLRVDRQDIPTFFLLALTGITFFFIAQYTGIKMAGASTAVIFVCLVSPILITAMSAAILQEQLTRKQTLGIGIGAIGTLTIIVGGTLTLELNNQFFAGSLILLSTPILWATYTIVGKRTIDRYNPFVVVAYATLLGGPLLIPFSLAENSFQQILTVSLNAWLAILFLSFTCSLIGYYIWFYVMEKTNPSVTSSFLFAEPLVTATLAVTLVGEKITSSLIIGGLIIFVGVYLIAKKQETERP